MCFDLKNITIKFAYKSNFIEKIRAFPCKKYGNYVNKVVYYLMELCKVKYYYFEAPNGLHGETNRR